MSFKVGDTIIITSGRDYSLTTTGATGIIKQMTTNTLLVEFDVNTLSEQGYGTFFTVRKEYCRIVELIPVADKVLAKIKHLQIKFLKIQERKQHNAFI